MSSYKRTLRDDREKEDTGTFRGATGTITTEANLVFDRDVSDCLAPQHLQQTYVNESSLVAKRSSLKHIRDVGVTNTPELTRKMYTLRAHRSLNRVELHVPSVSGRTIYPGLFPGDDFEVYDYGNDTVVVLPSGTVEPGTGVWNVDTYASKVDDCKELTQSLNVELRLGAAEYMAPPQAPETPTDREKRVRKKQRFLARYIHEYLRFGRPVGLTTFVNAKQMAHEYAISLFVQGATTTHNRENFPFFPCHPVYCTVPMSVDMRAEVDHVLKEGVAHAIPITTKLVVPEGRSYVSTDFVGVNCVEEYNLVPSTLENALKLFGCLPRAEFESAMSLAYIGRTTAGSGEDQGVAVNFKFSTRV